MRKFPVKALASVILMVSILGIAAPVPRVFAAGTVCIAPDLPAQTACPSATTTLTGPVTTGPSTQIRVQVFLAGSDPMNGADIVLKVDPTVLNPVGVDFTGTLFPPGFNTLAECINGALITGSSCNTTTDVLGTIHVSIVGFGGGLSPSGETGILFTGIFDIVGASASTTIGFQNVPTPSPGCNGQSAAPGDCVKISNGTTSPVMVTAQTAGFTSSSTQASLQLSPNGGSLGTFFSGVSPAVQALAVTDIGGAYLASGQADGGGDTSYSLSTTIIGPTSTATGISATVSPSSFTFASGTPGPFAPSLTITSASTAAPGAWSVIVTGQYHFDQSCVGGVPGTCAGPASTLIQSITYTLTVADFIVTVPSSANTFVPYWCSPLPGGVTGACPTGNGATQTITVIPAGYTGTVTVATATGTPSPVTSPALTVSYTSTTIPGASGSSTVIFTNGMLRPTTTTITGAYTVRTTLTGTLPTGSRTKTLTWIVRPQDFNVTTSNGTPTGPSISFNSGSQMTDSLTIGSLPSGSAAAVSTAGFAGQVSLSPTITGGTGLVVTPATTPVTLTAGGKLTDVVTFSGAVSTTTTFSVTLTGTATLSVSIPSTTQTHSVTYSVTITGTSHPTSTVVNCVPGSVSSGTGTSCTATVTDTSASGATTPTGSVSFTSSGTGTFTPATSCPLVGGATGTASCSVTYTPGAVGTGTHTITANYGGDTSHSSSLNTFALTVTPAISTVTITTTLSSSTITVGGSVTDSATLSGNTANAGGIVTYTFFTGTACSGTGTVVGTPVTVTSGVVPNSASQTFNTAGSFGWNAAYSGDTNNSPATSPCEPFTVNQASPTIATSLSSNSIPVGGSVTDSATLTGGFQATGTVTYSFFSGLSCSGAATPVGSPVSVTGGLVPNSAPQTFAAAGLFSWNAVYSGDTNNKGATSPCEPLTVNPAGVSITTNLSSSSISVGGSITDSATLTGATPGAGGTVTYSFFTGSTCAGTGTVVGSPVTVTNGIIPNSASQAFNSAGSFSWHAVYSGDTNNNGATSGCEPLTVNKANPTISTTLSSNPITAGGSVADSATLTNSFNAGGTVTYSFFTGSTCTGTGTTVGTPVTVTGGVVPNSASQTFPSAGSFSWNAIYSGDANNNGATSACEPLTVNPLGGAVLSTSLSATSITVGGSATDSATLTGVTANAGGTVTYSFFTGSACSGTGTVVGSPVTVTAGVVPNSASQAFNSAGSFSWNAVYSGDTNNGGTTSSCEPLTVNKASPTIATSLASTSIVVGGSVTDSATLIGGFQAGGTVTYNFFTGSTCGGAATPVGTPVSVTGGVVPNSAAQTFSSAGSFSWNAVYSGDSNNNGATSACEPLTVNKASPTIATTLSAVSINQGASVTDSATLSNGFNAGGTVAYSFFSGSTCVGTGTQVGTAVTVTSGVVPNSPSQSFANAGSFSWNAVYSGDANDNGATSACEPLTVNVVTVVTITTTLSSGSITVGASITDSATLAQVTSTAGGTVTYSFFTGSSCSGTGTVVGSAVTVTNGVVPDSASQAFNSAGAFSWNAVYSGDANNAGATSACEPLTVNQAAPTIVTTVSSTTVSLGTAVHDSATLSNSFNAGGTVTYNLFASATCSGRQIAALAVTVSGGVVPDSPAFPQSSAGSFSWNAAYSGDANNMAAVSACEPFTVLKATPTISTSLSATQITAGGSVTDSATLSGSFNAFGTVSYNLFSTIDCSGTSSLVSTVSVQNNVVPNSVSQTFNSVGSFGWTGFYSGDGNNTAATSACEPLTVALSTTAVITTSLSSTTVTVGGSVFDTAKLSGVTASAGGTVTYTLFNGTGCVSGRIVGTVTVVNGVVPNSPSVTFLFVGSFSWNAAYSGDANNNAVTSACEPLTVNQAAPTISTTLSATQVNVGQSVTDSATLSNSFQANGFVTYKLFSAGDCSGIATIISNVTVTNGVVPNSASRLFNTTGTFGWNAFYSGDLNNVAATSACEPLTVSSVTGAPFLLTLQAFNFSAFHNGIGPFTVLVNGHVVVVFPGHGFVSSSSTAAFGTDKWVNLGPYDITAFVIPGQNNVTFVNMFGSRFSLIRNVMVTQGSTVFLNFNGPRFVSPNRPLVLTFSNPPLVITSFTMFGNPVVDGNVTFTATFTGGTAPFKCIFRFGDDESVTVAATGNTCSATHDFDDPGTFNVKVIVVGSSTSDRVSAQLSVTVTDPPALTAAVATGALPVSESDDD